MNSKTERVSAKQLAAVAAKNYSNITEVNWDDGIVIKVKASLSLNETANFVTAVADMCFGDDGEYHPEFLDFAMQTNIATIYGNLELPEDIEEQYYLLCTTGVCDYILQYVNKAQFKEVVKAVDRKLKYLSDSNVTQVRNEITKFADATLELKDKTDSFMDKLKDVDMQKILEQIAGFNLEDAIQKAVVGASNNNEKDIATTEDDK